ncbi:hypothetical protein DYQ86_20985 [Acidobacteria bacterium AB60]|nr:hypothetical protein DYQ86_20985 [Acidobacteria bacterium AB60]
MRLLSDVEIKYEIENRTPSLVQAVDTSDWTSRDSQIQPCSVDLTIGRIQVPGESENGPVYDYSLDDEGYVLRNGETAVLTTRETLNMPPNTAGIGFPPSHVSIKGLLMTNPGHVDPGFSGPMHFTVINMGRSPYPLRVGDAICTLLLFELNARVAMDWHARHPDAAIPTTGLRPNAVNRLARDFANVEARAQAIASEAVDKAESRATRTQWIAGTITVVFVTLITVASQFIPYYLGGIEEAKRNLAVAQSELASLRAQVTELKNQLSSISRSSPGTDGAQREIRLGH